MLSAFESLFHVMFYFHMQLKCDTTLCSVRIFEGSRVCRVLHPIRDTSNSLFTGSKTMQQTILSTSDHCVEEQICLAPFHDWVINTIKTLTPKLSFFFYHHKNNIKRKLFNITMYCSQRERTRGYHAPIANDTYNS